MNNKSNKMMMLVQLEEALLKPKKMRRKNKDKRFKDLSLNIISVRLMMI